MAATVSSSIYYYAAAVEQPNVEYDFPMIIKRGAGLWKISTPGEGKSMHPSSPPPPSLEWKIIEMSEKKLFPKVSKHKFKGIRNAPFCKEFCTGNMKIYCVTSRGIVCVVNDHYSVRKETSYCSAPNVIYGHNSQHT